jgi:hypothetical protein
MSGLITLGVVILGSTVLGVVFSVLTNKFAADNTKPTAADERAAIVAWMRTYGAGYVFADAIELGEHWPTEGAKDYVEVGIEEVEGRHE